MIRCHGHQNAAARSDGKRDTRSTSFERKVLRLLGARICRAASKQGMDELSQGAGTFVLPRKWQAGAVHYHEMLK